MPDARPEAVTVLIVDDHALFRSRARRLVEAAGYAVVGEADDAASAIAQSRRLEPDVVLLDVQLPDADGFTIAADLRDEPHSPSVVLISSREAIDYGSHLAAATAVGFIHKPELSRASLDRILAKRDAN
jgi:DNA-binding NarL/FixJ family response regulator